MSLFLLKISPHTPFEVSHQIPQKIGHLEKENPFCKTDGIFQVVLPFNCGDFNSDAQEYSFSHNSFSIGNAMKYNEYHGWLIFMVNVGKYTIHGSYGIVFCEQILFLP